MRNIYIREFQFQVAPVKAIFLNNDKGTLPAFSSFFLQLDGSPPISHFFAGNLTPMAQNLKVLIIGGTGYIGKFIVQASAKAGHPTYALIRKSSLASPAKYRIINHFKSLGVNFLFVSRLSSISLDFVVSLLRIIVESIAE